MKFIIITETQTGFAKHILPRGDALHEAKFAGKFCDIFRETFFYNGF